MSKKLDRLEKWFAKLQEKIKLLQADKFFSFNFNFLRFREFYLLLVCTDV